jgi:hypothetical protein
VALESRFLSKISFASIQLDPFDRSPQGLTGKARAGKLREVYPGERICSHEEAANGGPISAAPPPGEWRWARLSR